MQILYSLSLVSIVASQLFFVLFVRAELDGSIRHDPHHGSRVSPPQAEQPILHVSAVDESEGLLVVANVFGQEQRQILFTFSHIYTLNTVVLKS